MIALSAWNGDVEPGRLTRLNKLHKALLKLCDPRTLAKIRALHDHKGCLSVDWLEKPSSSDVYCVTRAWNDFHECVVNHFIHGAPFLMDTAAEHFGL